MIKYFTTSIFLLIGLIGFSQTGSVGVGTNAPLTKLDVNGDLALREGTAIAVADINPILVVTLSATDVENSFYKIIQGIPAPTGTTTLNSIANGADGQIIVLVNATTINLKITNNNTNSGILTPTGTPVTIPTNGSVTLQYSINSLRWYITSASSGGVLPDWVKANTASDPAGTLDSQYVNAKIGIGDFQNGAVGGSNLEGWITIKTPSNGTPSIVNPIKDAGIVLQGEGGTPSIKSRFRLVSNNNGWKDQKATSYLQISSDFPNNFDKSNLTIMSGSSGHDVTFNRFQINSDSTQITDYDFGATPRPSSIFELISGRNVAKSIFHIKGIPSQTGNFMDISSDTTLVNRGNVMTVLSTGNVGIGIPLPKARLHIVALPAVTSFVARFTQNNTTIGRNIFLGLGTENAAFSKGAIGYERTGSYDVGDITFNLSNDATSVADVKVADEKVRIKNNGDIQMTGSEGKLWLETNGWTDPAATGAGIAVDNSSYKSMMIVGNNVAGNKGQKREIQMWDYVKINGYLTVGDQTKATATAPPSGTMRYNTTRNCMEYWDGTYWICMGAPTVQKVTVRDQIDANYTGTGCNACSGWAGSYGSTYNFTINNLYAGQKVMFYVEVFLDNDTHKNSGFPNAMKIYGPPGYFVEDESPSPGWEASITKVFPAQTVTTTGNIGFTFECNQGFTDLRITSVAY